VSERGAVKDLEARIAELETRFRERPLGRARAGFSVDACTSACTDNCTSSCTTCCMTGGEATVPDDEVAQALARAAVAAEDVPRAAWRQMPPRMTSKSSARDSSLALSSGMTCCLLN